MKILVTGAGGFIGSHLVEALLRQGHDVVAMVRYTSHGSIGYLGQVADQITIVRGDIRDYGFVSDSMRSIDVVYHLAALIGIPYSYVAPESYLDVNVKGTLNILRAAGGARVVLTSTSEVYGSAQCESMAESHVINPQSPYAASKVAADALGTSFRCSFDADVITVRPFNTYGPRQSTRAVIPTIITQLLKGDSLMLGSLAPERDFLYVGDTVNAFIAAGDATEGGVTHFGTGECVSIGKLVEVISRLMGIKPVVWNNNVKRDRPEDSEVNRLCCDPSRAKELYGWSPQVTLEEGLMETIDWLRQNTVEALIT